MKQTNDESKQQAMMEQQAKDKQAVNEKQREAALQERNKNVLAIAKPMYGRLKRGAHRLHSANLSLQPILQVASKLLSGINKQRQVKRLRNEVWRGRKIESTSSDEKIRVAAIPGVAVTSNKPITTNEAANEQQGRLRTRTATNNTGKRNAIMGNALLVANTTVPTTNNKLLKSNGKYAEVPLMPATVKSSGRLNDKQTRYSVLAGMQGINIAAANEVKTNPGTTSEVMQKITKPEYVRCGVCKNYMQVANGLNALTTRGAAVVHKQRNSTGNMRVIHATTPYQV